MPSLRQDFAICPVTAVLHATTPQGAVILAGEGSLLKVYSRAERRLLLVHRIFLTQAIHGLQPGLFDSLVSQFWCLVWGGRSVKVICINVRQESGLQTASVSQTSCEVESDHWILHGIIFESPALDQGTGPARLKAALITSNNALLTLDLAKDRKGVCTHRICMRKSCQGPSSMLYSADLVLHGKSSVIIAAGTVYGEALLWIFDLASSERTIEPSCGYTSLRTFIGHEGSVFGVIIAATPGGRIFVATCSDDRTVRVWDPKLLAEAYSTPSEEIISDSKVALLAQATGHYSRIWSVRLNMFSEYFGRLISFGEDCMAQEWLLSFQKLQSPQDLVGSLQARNALTAHSGKNIWSASVVAESSTTTMVVTGGADGQITLSSTAQGDLTNETRSSATAESSSNSETFLLSDRISRSDQPTPTDSHKVCTWLDGETLLAVTQSGRVLIGIVTAVTSAEGTFSIARSVTDSNICWDQVYQTDDLRSHCTVRRIAGFGAAMCGVKGCLFLFSSATNEVRFIENLSRKVASMYNIQVTLEDGTHPALVISCAGSDLASLLILRNGAGTLRVRLALPRYTFVTSATFFNSSGRSITSTSNRQLLLGTRSGSLLMFDATKLTEENVLLSSIIPLVHGRDAVTAIVDITTLGNAIEPLIVTTGRDCKLRVHSIIKNAENANNLSLLKVHEADAPQGTCLEGAMIESATQALLVWGFRGADLILYNVTENRQITRANCGGSHRDWDVLVCAGGSGCVRASWTRASACHIYFSNQPSYGVVKPGIHGREIRTLAFQPGHKTETRLVATGSEDTEIHISAVLCSTADSDVSSTSLKVLARIKKHNTGLCRLAWSDDGRYLFSAGGKEEFFVWRLRRIPCVDVGVVCESAIPFVTEAADLRIMDFTVQGISSTADNKAGKTDAFYISTVYSDSSVRTWLLDMSKPDDQRLRLLIEGKYEETCLTNVRGIHLGSDSRERLLTTATDGHIALWPALGMSPANDISDGRDSGRPGNYSYEFRHKVQGAAVKCLDVSNLTGGTLFVVAGGDDNALSFTLVRAGTFPDHQVAAASTLLIPKAHAAAVTAVQILYTKDEGNRQTVTLATASNDQTVKIWRAAIIDEAGSAGGVTDLRRLHVRRISRWNSNIADISDMDVIGQEKLVVAGIGMEILSLVDEDVR